MSETDNKLNFRFGDFVIDVAARELYRKGEPVDVQPRVFDLLVYLVRHHDRMVDKDELQDAVWPGRIITETALTRAVMKARKAVDDDANQQAVIKTLHGHGYHFVAEVEAFLPDQPAVLAGGATGESPTGKSGSSLSVRFTVVLLVLLVIVAAWKFMPGASVQEPARSLPAAENTVQARPVENLSIAVLPFANRSNREEDQFFADGIHDDLLTKLAKVGSLKVISRTSVMRYRDSEQSIPQIATELGVATILEGGIQRSGDHVRINMQLIDAATDDHLWAEIYDRQLNAENLFSIQSEISHEIVEALHATMNERESRRLDEAPTQNMEAYAEYVLGRQALASRTEESLRRARANFERAIELDENYVLAHVGLADALNLLASYSTGNPAELMQLRQSLLNRALALDPDSGEAWTSLASLRVDQNRLEEAEEYFLKAIELSPNYSTAYHWYAYLLENSGRSQEALPVIRNALELDPNASILTIQYARVLWNLGRAEAANAALIEGLKRNPLFPSFYMNMATNLRETGRLGQSMQWLNAGVQLDARPVFLKIAYCKRFLDFADDERAEICFNEVEASDSEAAIGSRLELHQFRGQFPEALVEARDLASRFELPFAQNILAWNLIYNGLYEEVLDLARSEWPHLLDGPVTSLASSQELNSQVVTGMALVATGEQDRGDRLLDEALQHMQSLDRNLGEGFGELDITVHAFRGDASKAVDSLRQAVSSGWRDNWWRLRFPIYANVSDNTDWNNLVEMIEADVAGQWSWYETHKNDSLF